MFNRLDGISAVRFEIIDPRFPIYQPEYSTDVEIVVE
jgi:hypothetical protein